MTPQQKNIVRNAIAGFLFAIAVVSFASSIVLQSHWQALAPTVADPTVSAIYPINFKHDAVRYFTAFQVTALSLSHPAFLLATIGLVIVPKKNEKYFSKFGLMKVTFDSDDQTGIQRRANLAGAIAAPVALYWLGPVLVHWLNGAGIVLQW